MNLYSVDIRVAMTAYIKAESEKDALKIARENFHGETHELVTGGLVNGADFDSESLPAISLSPAITFVGVDTSTIGLCDEDIPYTEDRSW